jgi:hypothetical protein
MHNYQFLDSRLAYLYRNKPNVITTDWLIGHTQKAFTSYTVEFMLLKHVTPRAAQTCHTASYSNVSHRELLKHVTPRAAQTCHTTSCSNMSHRELLKHVTTRAPLVSYWLILQSYWSMCKFYFLLRLPDESCHQIAISRDSAPLRELSPDCN